MSAYCDVIGCNCKYCDEEEGCLFYYTGSGEEDKPCHEYKEDKLITKRMSVTEFLTNFSDIEDINDTYKIVVFSEGYSKKEYDAIYDLLHNKWKVNKLYRLNEPYKIYDYDHTRIKRQLILVENCDLEVIDDAYELYEYLDMGYELYLVLEEEDNE